MATKTVTHPYLLPCRLQTNEGYKLTPRTVEWQHRLLHIPAAPVPMATQQAITGCFIGHAVGDALGFVVEGYSQKICADYISQVID